MPAVGDYARNRWSDDERARVFGELSPTTSSTSPATIGLAAGDPNTTDEGLVVGAQQIETSRWVSRAASAWEKMDDTNRLSYWDRLTEVERTLLSQNGISPPIRNRFMRALAGGAKAAFEHNPITLTVKGTLDVLSKFERARNHYVRSNLSMQEEQGQLSQLQRFIERFGDAASSVLPVKSALAMGTAYIPRSLKPSTWRHYWDQTSNGEGTFWQSAENAARAEGLEGDDLEFAKQIAEGITASTLADDEESQALLAQQADSVLLDLLTEQVDAGVISQEEAVEELAQMRGRLAEPDSGIMRGLRHLVNGRISTGRAAAMLMGYEPGTSAFSWASGSGDALNAFVDVDLAAGVGLKSLRVGLHGITKTSRLSNRATKIAIQRGGSHAVAARALRPSLRGLLTDVTEEGDVATRLTNMIRTRGAKEVLRPSVRRWTSKVSDALNDEVTRIVDGYNEGRDVTRKLSEALEEGVEAPSGVARLIREEPKFASIIDDIARHVGIGPAPGMQANGLLEVGENGLQATRPIDDADVLEFFTDRIGVQAILQGRIAGHLQHRPLMPHISFSHLPFKKVKQMMKARIDWADDSPMRAWEKLRKAGHISDEEWTEVVERGGVRFKLREAKQVATHGHPMLAATTLAYSTAGRLAKNLTTTTPARVVDLMGDDAVTQIQRFGAYLPRRMGDELVNQFAAARSTQGRYRVVRSMMDEIFTRLGVKDAPGGADWADSFLKTLDAEHGHIFALDGLDTSLLPNGERIRTAINLDQTAAKMQLPDIKSLWGYSTRASFWSHATGSRIFNKDAIDVAIGRFWSPAVLMRMGFVLRAAGDEAMQFAMREGFGSYLKARIAYSATSDKALFDPMWKAMGFMHERMIKRDGWYAGLADKAVRMNDAHRFYGLYRASEVAPAMARMGQKMVRGVEQAFVPQRYVEAGRLLSRHSDSTVARHLTDLSASAQGGHLYRYIEHMSDAERALRIHDISDEAEDIWQGTRFTGAWDELDISENADAFFNATRNRMVELGKSEDDRILLEIISEKMTEVVEAARQLDGPTLQKVGEILSSSRFKIDIADEWVRRVSGTELEGKIFNRVLRANSTPDGRMVVTGKIEDIPTEFLDKWASKEEGLWHYAQTQYDLIRQRIFTLPDGNKVQVPLPGVLSTLLDPKKTIDLDQIRSFYYHGDDIPAKLADELKIRPTGEMPSEEEIYREIFFNNQREAAEYGIASPEGLRQVMDDQAIDDALVSDEEFAGFLDRIGDEWETLMTRAGDEARIGMDHGLISTKTPTRAPGPTEESNIKSFKDVFDRISGLMVDRPMAAMGIGINYISREPIFLHYLAKGMDISNQQMWRSRAIQRGVLDRLKAEVDGHPVVLAPAAEVSRAMEDFRHAFDDVFIDDLGEAVPMTFEGVEGIVGTDVFHQRMNEILNPRGVNFEFDNSHFAHGSWYQYPDGHGEIVISLDSIQRDWDVMMDRLNGIDPPAWWQAGPGSVVHWEKFERMGIDRDEMFMWLRDNGGFDAYVKLVVAHEYGHMTLAHKGTHIERSLDDFTITKEMAADQFAFDVLEMPFKGLDTGFEFTDGRHALDYLERIQSRGAYARSLGPQFHVDYSEMLRDDDIGHQLLDIANRSGFKRLDGEDDFAFTKRVFERTWETEGEVFETAFQYAINNTLPFVDSVPVASFMARWGRNMVPFWWAEERFIKRLAQSAYQSPEAIWRAQVAYNGLRNVGVIQTDEETGADFFIYPGNAMSHYALAGLFTVFTGEDYAIPQYEQIRGRVLMSLPGLDEMGRPSVGPLQALPLRLLRGRFNEIDAVIDPVLGDFAASDEVSNWELMLPSVLTRAWKAWSPEQAKSHYASANLEAMRVLMANGHDVEWNENLQQFIPVDVEEFSDKAARLTHIIAAMRVVYGFAGFAPPEVTWPEGNEARERLFELTNALGYTEGLAQWAQEFPDKTAYQVFSTEVEGGTYLPATEETLAFMNQHEDFMRDYPAGAAYFIPTPASDVFEFRAWSKQMELGLRSRKEDEELFRAARFAAAAPLYFESQAEYERARAAYTGTPYAAEIDNRWHKWQQTYFELHPTFEDELKGDDREERRRRILRDLKQAFIDERLPLNETTEALRMMYDGLMTFKAGMSNISGFHTKPYMEYRAALRERFLVWADQMVEASPQLESFFLRVVLPEMNINEDEAEQMMLEATSGP